MTPSELRSRRCNLGLTQEKLAAILGVTGNTVARWERAARSIGNPEMVRLALERLEERSNSTARALGAAPAGNGQTEPLFRPAAEPHHNLPHHRSGFVGRQQETIELTRLLRGIRGTTGLLTLTGVAGVGKTRLALSIASNLQAEFADGVWQVELAPLGVGLVPQAVAAALGVHEQARVELIETIAALLRSRHLLLVLDNCEHVLGECAAVADALLRTCPYLTILATSRERLGISAETVWRVPSLMVPPQLTPRDWQHVAEFDAVGLFIERARAALPSFRLTEGNAALVAELCIRLDGLPLAIELAAAWVRVIGINQILQRLDDSFRLLVGGNRAASAGQQTVRGALDWSHRLLTENERVVFRRLAVAPSPARDSAPPTVQQAFMGHPVPSRTTGREGAGVWRMVEFVLRDAAHYLDVNVSELQVERVEFRDWPDTSLGCPDVGESYDYVATPGYIVFVYGGLRQLEYHTDTQSRFVRCSGD